MWAPKSSCLSWESLKTPLLPHIQPFSLGNEYSLDMSVYVCVCVSGNPLFTTPLRFSKKGWDFSDCYPPNPLGESSTNFSQSTKIFSTINLIANYLEIFSYKFLLFLPAWFPFSFFASAVFSDDWDWGKPPLADFFYLHCRKALGF